MNKNILLSITTTNEATWMDRIREVDELELEEVALFPTNFLTTDRKLLYRLLEETGLKKIPHVHLREDFSVAEIEYFISRWHTKVFNIHLLPDSLKLLSEAKAYRDIIFLENLNTITPEFIAALEMCGGICLDISHWEDWGVRQSQPGYENFLDLLKKYRIGCNHISAITDQQLCFTDKHTGETKKAYNRHFSRSLKDFDYLKKYTAYLSPIISIELENSLEEQLKIKKHLEKTII
jgi:hypothetical protein